MRKVRAFREYREDSDDSIGQAAARQSMEVGGDGLLEFETKKKGEHWKLDGAKDGKLASWNDYLANISQRRQAVSNGEVSLGARTKKPKNVEQEGRIAIGKSSVVEPIVVLLATFFYKLLRTIIIGGLVAM